MATKIRKQIYLESEQDRLLKHLSRKTGVSEAELIRNAIDQQMDIPNLGKGRHNIWKEEAGFIRRLMRKPQVKGKRTWRRKDLYEG
ncbi:ribbon-helix-helix domain-containing protein [bacterium]|nr:ribbon-helix-helix domain-containing protein [bacterium]